MFRFANPDQLFWLLLVPLLVGFAWLSWKGRRQALRRFVAEPMLARLAADVDPRRRVWKMLLLLAAVILLLTALAILFAVFQVQDRPGDPPARRAFQVTFGVHFVLFVVLRRRRGS